MLRKLKIRHFIGLLLISYQIFVDFHKEDTLNWYVDLVYDNGFSIRYDTYEGPLLWIAAFIFHRAIVHTLCIFCFTGNRLFTQVYGIVEGLLLIGLILFFALKQVMGEWVLFSFDFFNTFLELLNSPLLLILFLPSYFIFKQQNILGDNSR